MLSTCSANRALAIRAQEAGDDITGAKAGDDITGVGVSIKGSSMKDKVRNQREMISCKHGDFTLAVCFKQNRPRCMKANWEDICKTKWSISSHTTER